MLLCPGNHNATAYVYETSTGLQVGRIGAIRVQGSVRACGLSDDCRHLLMVVGSGYIFRFESRPVAADSEEDDGPSSPNGDIVMRDGSTPPPGLQPEVQPLQQEQQQLQQLGRHQDADQATDDGGQQQLSGSGGVSYGLLPEPSSPQQQNTAGGTFKETLGSIAGNTPDAGTNNGWAPAGLQGDLGAGWMHDDIDGGACMMVANATLGLDQAQDDHIISQQKRPRLEGARVSDASPLVFRSTPMKD